MSHKHTTAARFCPMFKGNARLLLFILCDRAGSGSRFKNGKKSVFGWTPKLSDKTLMRSLNCPRRESIRQWRGELRRSGAIKTKLVNQSSGWPVYRYFVDFDWLEKHDEESDHNAAVLLAGSNTDDESEDRSTGDVEFQRTETVRDAARKASVEAHEKRAEHRTKSAAQSGLPSEVLPTALPFQGGEEQGGVSRLTPTSESVSGTNVAEAETEANETAHPNPPTGKFMSKKLESKRESGNGIRVPKAPIPQAAVPPSQTKEEEDLLWIADYLAKAYNDLFPTHEIDSNHFATLMRRGHDPLDIEAIMLNFLPVTNFPGLESSADFMLAYKELARQWELYKLRGFETFTESRMAAWIEKNRAARKDAADFEKLEVAFNRDDTPIDPDDAAEEEAWLAADQAIEDGDTAELDPMQDAFAGEREDAEFEDGMHDAFIELPIAPLPPEVIEAKRLEQENYRQEEEERVAKAEQERLERKARAASDHEAQEFKVGAACLEREAKASPIKAELDAAAVRIAKRDAINPNWDKLSAAEFRAMTEEIQRRDATNPDWYKKATAVCQ